MVSRRRQVASVVAFCGIGGLLLPFLTGCPPTPPPAEVRIPGPDSGSVQSGIDTVADGGAVHLGPGVYTESLNVTGKNVRIIGGDPSDPGRTEIVSADPDSAVITFGPGGGGTVDSLTLSGGAFGIEGVMERKAAGDFRPSPVSVQRTRIQDSGQGIFGDFTDITISHTTIQRMTWHGVAVLSFGDTSIIDSFIGDTDAVGLVVYNDQIGPGAITLDGVNAFFNSQGGIVVAGSARPVEILNCRCGFNGLAGVMLLRVGQAVVRNTNAVLTGIYEGPNPAYTDQPTYHDIGDNFVAFESGYVDIANCLFMNAARVGVIFADSNGIIRDTTSTEARFGLVSTGSPQLDYDHASNTFQGSEQNILTDGNLPVPEAPPIPEG